ncbi:cupin domain-containing protein [Gynuella sunshinyii]|uniref:Putative enzyme of the cupin superfamily n=1 Tax=Gynuella sunshinyii YC6258 TaxID=1445510 RepID=A0A0C5VWI3_9GAMM|nr:cupin domain-containing protein [Gynuella sunshinyii]AJQ97668.1 putative enzyme of the cupin superfamily [Gynuella sunshinyii YC6258]
MIKTDLSNVELQPWGVVSDLGAEILEGDCNIFGAMTFGAPTEAVSSAYFGSTRGKFKMTYPFNEHAVIVEGQVTIKNLSTGEQNSYSVGDSWFVEKGTECEWTVDTERFVKHYLAVA